MIFCGWRFYSTAFFNERPEATMKVMAIAVMMATKRYKCTAMAKNSGYTSTL
jgi:hypothetical protein